MITGNKCLSLGVKLNEKNQANYDALHPDEINDEVPQEDALPNKTVEFEDGTVSYLLSEKNKKMEQKSEAPSTPPRSVLAWPGFAAAKSPLKSPPPKSTSGLADAFAKLYVGAGEEDITAEETQTGGDSVSSMDKSKLEKLILEFKPPDEDGTREKPFKEWINLEHPERNQTFCVQPVQGMKRKEWKRNGVHIRKLVCAPDAEGWTMEIPSVHEFPLVQGRCALVRRPAYTAVEKSPALYHAKLEITKECTAVKEAHTNHVVQNATDVSGFVYHLLIFPEGIELDNAHFAGMATPIVDTNFTPVTLKKDDSDNPFGKDVHMLYAYWEIAEASGGIRVAAPGAKSADFKSYF